MKHDARPDSPEEALFWEIVRSAPFVEADELLRRRRHDAIARRIEATAAGNGEEVARIDLLLTRIKDELHRLNASNHGLQLQQAVKAVCGEEAWEQVKLYLVEHQIGSNPL